MKHPALAKVMSAALAVLCVIMIAFGALNLDDAAEERMNTLEAADNLDKKINTYVEAERLLAESAVDYEALSAKMTERQEQYNTDNSQHRADLATYTATKSGLAMGDNALQMGAELVQKGWNEYYKGIAAFEAQTAEYGDLLTLVEQYATPEMMELAKNLLDEAEKGMAEIKPRLDEAEAKIDELAEQGITQEVMDCLAESLEKMNARKAELEPRKAELDALDAENAALLSFVDSVVIEVYGDDSIPGLEKDAVIAERIMNETGRTADEIRDTAAANSTELCTVNTELAALDAAITAAQDSLNCMSESLCPAQAIMDEVQKLYDLALEKLGEAKDLYDKVVMYFQAKDMMTAGKAALEASDIEIATAWYQLQLEKEKLEQTGTELSEEKTRLENDYDEVEELSAAAREYEELLNRRDRARTALRLYPEIKSGIEDGGDIVECAERHSETMRASAEKDYKGHRLIYILCIAAGVLGLFTLPAAYERMRTYPWLILFPVLCFLCAAAADGVGMALGWGQTYAALCGAIVALLMISVSMPDRKVKV